MQTWGTNCVLSYVKHNICTLLCVFPKSRNMLQHTYTEMSICENTRIANRLYLFMVWVMDDWRCKTGRRLSKRSRGGDWRWEVSTGMLMLRRNPCLFTGYTRTGHVRTKVSTQVTAKKRTGLCVLGRPPEQKWEARLVTSEVWECPGGAREASSSAGCWCSPAVVQPCSLSHPRPASYTDRDVVVRNLNKSHGIFNNSN